MSRYSRWSVYEYRTADLLHLTFFDYISKKKIVHSKCKNSHNYFFIVNFYYFKQTILIICCSLFTYFLYELLHFEILLNFIHIGNTMPKVIFPIKSRPWCANKAEKSISLRNASLRLQIHLSEYPLHPLWKNRELQNLDITISSFQLSCDCYSSLTYLRIVTI